jgi:hypothetical protein
VHTPFVRSESAWQADSRDRRSLDAHGAHVVGAARDLTKAEKATTQVRKDATDHRGSFELLELDLEAGRANSESTDTHCMVTTIRGFPGAPQFS